MSDYLTFAKVVLIGGASILTAALGGWDAATIAAVGFVVADLASALLQVLITGQFDSSIGRKGILTKSGYVLAIVGCHFFDTYVLKAPVLRTVTAWALAVNDAGSFFARLATWGVPLPGVVLQILQREIERKRGDSVEGR